MQNWVVTRAEEFLQRQEREPHRLRVLAEGDSWFSYPAGFWKGRKLVSLLREQKTVPLNLMSLANPGDTLYKLAFGGSAELELAVELVRAGGQAFDLVLLSAGGNDFFRRIEDVVPYREAPHVDEAVLAQLLRDLHDWYGVVLGRIRQRLRIAPVLLHGYDHVFPTTASRRILGLFPVGPWLGRHFAALGLKPQQQRAVARQLVDAFNDDLLAGLDGIVHLDLRGALRLPSDFADEIHPSPAGMEKLRDRFVAAIAAAT